VWPQGSDIIPVVSDRAATASDRLIRGADKTGIAEAMTAGPPEFEIQPSYNVAPEILQLVVRLNTGPAEREVVLMLWGVLPLWEAELKIGVPEDHRKG
jgi:putative SOS response-associated peptidase YedK